MERSKPEQIGQLVERLINDYHLDHPVMANKSMWLWGQIVGQGVNRLTTRRYVDGTVLHVWISSAPLKNELSFRSDSIMRAINSQLGTDFLTDLRIH